MEKTRREGTGRERIFEARGLRSFGDKDDSAWIDILRNIVEARRLLRGLKERNYKGCYGGVSLFVLGQIYEDAGWIKRGGPTDG